MFGARSSLVTSVPTDVITKNHLAKSQSRKIVPPRSPMSGPSGQSPLPQTSVLRPNVSKINRHNTSRARRDARTTKIKYPRNDFGRTRASRPADGSDLVEGRRGTLLHQTQLQYPEHSLSIAFKDATEHYKSHLSETIPTCLEEARKLVDERFHEAADHSRDLLEQYNKIVQPLCKPFNDEELVITQKRGTAHEQKIQSTLKARMAVFQRVLGRERTTQSHLLQELHDIDEEILKIGAGMQDSVSVSRSNDLTDPTSYAAKLATLEAKYATQKEEKIAKFEMDGKELIKKVEAEEQTYAQRAKLANQKFQRLLQATINEQDELAED